MKSTVDGYKNLTLSGDIKTDTQTFKEIFKKDSVVRFKTVKVCNSLVFECTVIFVDGMVDSERLNESVIKPLLVSSPKPLSEDIAEYIENQVLFASDVKSTCDLSKMIKSVLYGEALILTDGSKKALMADVKGWEIRSVEEPQNERILKGPREGFCESVLVNLSLLRRKLQTPDLCFEKQSTGKRSKTAVYVCYLDSLADENTVNQVKKRISDINIDGILDSNYIAELISKNNSLFKTCGTTERPDTVAARLLEGRIAVIVDGTPVALTVPFVFSENFQSDEDYYIAHLSASFGRMLRYLSFFLSILIPGISIAVSTYHKQLLPTSLAITVAKLRGGVPFSAFSECMIMLFVFEILKEAGVRMPQSLGHALSIVGGLVVGEAAVEARIISTPMLITVALSGIAGLMVPRLTAAVSYLRLLFVISGAAFGLYGIISVLCVVLMKIISLKSFSVDYTVSLRKANLQSLKDTLIRAPWSFMRQRPDFNRDKIRMSSGREKG